MKFIFAVLLILSFTAHADVKLAWDSHPTPADVRAFEVSCATAPGGPWVIVSEILGGTATTATVNPCDTSGRVYFTVRATGFSGNGSAPSNLASVLLDPLGAPVVACPETTPPPVVVKMKVTPISSTSTTRPLFADITRVVQIGRIANGTPCEDETLAKTTLDREWRWATNTDAIPKRGVTLCK